MVDSLCSCMYVCRWIDELLEYAIIVPKWTLQIARKSRELDGSAIPVRSRKQDLRHGIVA